MDRQHCPFVPGEPDAAFNEHPGEPVEPESAAVPELDRLVIRSRTGQDQVRVFVELVGVGGRDRAGLRGPGGGQQHRVVGQADRLRAVFGIVVARVLPRPGRGEKLHQLRLRGRAQRQQR